MRLANPAVDVDREANIGWLGLDRPNPQDRPIGFEPIGPQSAKALT
jgi:hypothetical protein